MTTMYCIPWPLGSMQLHTPLVLFDLLWFCWFVVFLHNFYAFIVEKRATEFTFSFVCLLMQFEIYAPCCILRIAQIFSAVSVSDVVPGSICSVQLIDAASVKNRFTMYSPWSRPESHFWDASEMHCFASSGITSFVFSGCEKLQQPECDTAVLVGSSG